MSVAALEAMEVAAALKRRFRRPGAAVFPKSDKSCGPAVDHLHLAAHSERVAAMASYRVANLLAPPPSVLRPRVVLSVLRGNLTRQVARWRAPGSQRTAAPG